MIRDKLQVKSFDNRLINKCKADKVKIQQKADITINDIIARLKEGDISAVNDLQKLGINYSTQTNEYGTQYDFEHNGTEYSIFVAKTPTTDNVENTTATENEAESTETQQGCTVVDTYDNLCKILSISEVSLFFENLPKEENNGKDLRKLKTPIMCEGKQIQTAEELAQAIKDGKEIKLDNAGNCSYTDENGNNVITGTWDVVYKNGIQTTITRDLNGKITNSDTYDTINNRQLNQIYYDENGKVRGSETWEYDETNPNFYTKIGRDADGNVSYRLQGQLLPVGNTVYNLVLQYEQYNDGEVVYEENYTLSQAIDRIINNFKENLNNIQNEMASMVSAAKVPIPPTASDYILADGTIDEEAYQKAYDKYKKECEEYDKHITMLNESTNSIIEQIEQLEAVKEQLELSVKEKELQEKLERLENSGKVDDKDLQALKEKSTQLFENMRNSSKELSQLKLKMIDLTRQLLRLSAPVPPNIKDFTNPDGSVNENAYNKAISKYEYAQHNYEYNVDRIGTEINILEQKILAKETELRVYQSELDSLNKEADSLLED